MARDRTRPIGPASPSAADAESPSNSGRAPKARRPFPPASRFAADAGGQMMMLAAVVLVLGFIALSGMVARVSEVGVQTGREQQRPLLLEVAPMKAGLDTAILRLKTVDGYQDDTDAHKAAYEGAIQTALQHQRSLEASRGLMMEYSFACATPGDPTTGYAAVSLTDGELWVQVHSATFKRASTATPC